MTLQELGQILQEKREAAGLSIDDVAARIKVSGRILRSIEQGSMDGLPHAIYTKSFIRSFGLMIGYNPEDLRQDLDRVFPPESLDESKKERVLMMRPVMTSTGGGRTVMLLLMLIIILAGLGAAGWYIAKNYGDAVVNFVKQPFSAISFSSGNDNRRPQEPAETGPAATPAPADTPPAQPQSAPEGQSALPPVPAPPITTPAQAPSASPPAQAPTALEATSAVAAPQADNESRMLITAQRTCWIGPTVDGEKLAPFTLKSGEQHTLVYSKTLELVLGNPSGISLSLNGKPLGSPGPGERVLQFP